MMIPPFSRRVGRGAAGPLWLGSLSFLLAAAMACSFQGQGAAGGRGGTGGPFGTGGVGGIIGPGTGGVPVVCHPCQDFPATPVLDTGAGAPPDDVATMFGEPGSGSASGGPCLADPEPASLFPQNWLRPRFHFVSGGGQTLFELRLHAPNEAHDLVVYTRSTTWTMPKELWDSLTVNDVDQDIEVTVRGLALGGKPALGTKSTFRIAPARAAGTIVYWTTSGGSALKGFSIGQEDVTTVITPTNTRGKCVGCHTSTPGGEFIGFSNTDVADNGDPARIEIRSGASPGVTPSFLTPAAKALLGVMSQELPTFSPAHWSAGDHVVVVMHGGLHGGDQSELLWIDLEATSQAEGVGWGTLARNGDLNHGPSYPIFSHDGTGLVYSSSPTTEVAGARKNGDLYWVEYDDRKGGKATPIAGAASPDFNEFYPALSVDDRFLAFTRVANGDSSYNNPKAEIFFLPKEGGTAVRHSANDPASCLNRTSPGITNSWPKWSPSVGKAGQSSYYWLTFSSTRGENGRPQIYVAGLVVNEVGAITMTPALYLWNQPAGESNHTPAWDEFVIPPPG